MVSFLFLTADVGYEVDFHASSCPACSAKKHWQSGNTDAPPPRLSPREGEVFCEMKQHRAICSTCKHEESQCAQRRQATEGSKNRCYIVACVNLWGGPPACKPTATQWLMASKTKVKKRKTIVCDSVSYTTTILSNYSVLIPIVPW